jgi:hypothetical protein
MQRYCVKPVLERTIEAWDKLDQDDREKLIPRLLNSIDGWRAFSYRSSSQLRWLEDRFKNAGLPFVRPINENINLPR